MSRLPKSRNIYQKADAIMRAAMGTRTDRQGIITHLADEDPLACWCGVEAILALATTRPRQDRRALAQQAKPQQEKI